MRLFDAKEDGTVVVDTSREWLSVAEAASELGVSEETLERKIRLALLPAFRVKGKVRILRKDVEAARKPPERTYEWAPLDLTTIRPLTPEQAEQALEWMRETKAFSDEVVARRGGKPFSSSVPLIRAARRLRSRQLLG